MKWSAARLEQKRKQEGRTVEWLADFCGVESLDQFRHYLSGRRKPKRPVVKLLALALNTTEEWIMGEDKAEQSRPSRRVAAG